MADISFIKDVKALKINGEPSHEYEDGSDLMRVGGVRQTPRPNNVPVFRDNGYELYFDELNEDYILLDSDYTFAVGDSIKMSFVWKNDSTRIFGNNNNSIISAIRLTNTRIRLEYSGGFVLWTTTNTIGASYEIEIIRTSGFFECIKNGVSLGLVADTSPSDFVFNTINKRASSIEDLIVYSFQLGGDVVNFTNFNGVDVYNDLGSKVGEIKTIHVDGDDYIKREVVQKKPFALVGNGTTEKIISPLGSELILTSTPLEGGFTLDGKIYDLKEGLGNKIVSRDGTTESEIVGFTGKSLNYGGWRKGNNVDGWIAYD